MPKPKDDKVVAIGDHLATADQAHLLPEPDDAEEGMGPPPGPPGPPDEPERATPKKLPPSAPITPLGWQDDEYYFLNARGALRILTDARMKREYIEGLFAPRTEKLVEFWPHWDKNREKVIGWVAQKAATTLRNVIAEMPPWDPSRRLRGRGAWLDDDGKLIYHAGDWLYRPGQKRVRPGFHGGYLYPKRADGLQPGKAAAAQEAFGLLQRLVAQWTFQRGEDAERLVLGHIATQLVCGALPFRPALYLTGDRGSGKTTLMEAMMTVSNGIYTDDATAAGVYQATRDNAQPVALDETETDLDIRKQRTLLKLMRSCSTGSLILRGTGEHRSLSFTARSSIVFGSITPLQMSGADYSRMPVLELGIACGKLHMPSKEALQKAGADILDLLLRRWDDFLVRAEVWRDALLTAGHDARGADAYGYLLAGACFVESPDSAPPADQIAAEAKRYAVVAQRESDDESMGQKCLDVILHHPAQVAGSPVRQEVFEIVRRLCERYDHTDPDRLSRDKNLALTLAQHGLTILVRGTDKAGNVTPPAPITKASYQGRDYHYLAVANRHPGLVRLFDASENPWRTAHGSAQSGWTPALRRLTGEPWRAHPHPDPLYFSGKLSRAIVVQIDHLLESAS